jgi:hypothetical protein
MTETTTVKDTLSGREIRAAMRAAGVRIADVAASMQVTQKRVRQVRLNGVRGLLFVRDWLEGIEGAALWRNRID